MKINKLKKLGTLITLTGKVESDMVKAFDSELVKLFNDEKNPEKKATILLSTAGGSVLDGDAIAERIKFASRFADLQIIAMTYVMSSGVRILLSLPREKRFASPGAIIMIHPMGRPCEAISKVSVDEEMRQLTERLLGAGAAKKRETVWVKQLAREMGKSYKATKAMWETSHRFTAKEAIENGLVSAIFR
ncbi:MAG: ATP-dependent Clp protease proteolytic subunit [Patescibacteria group bacterium]